MFEIRDECHELDDAGLAEGLGRRLRAANLPLDRLTLYLRTLDLEILARTVAWALDEPAEIHERQHGIELLAGFADSPARRVIETQEPLVLWVDDRSGVAWLHTDVFEGRHLVEFVIVPLRNANWLT